MFRFGPIELCRDQTGRTFAPGVAEAMSRIEVAAGDDQGKTLFIEQKVDKTAAKVSSGPRTPRTPRQCSIARPMK